MHIREAAQTLAEFARTAPGRLPERVELAIKATEEPPPTVSLRSLEAAVNGAILPGETAAEAIDRLASVAACLDKGAIVRAIDRLASVAACLDNKGAIVRAAENEDTLSTIRDLLMVDDHAAGDVIVERLLALLPKSLWTYGQRGWYRDIIGSGKRVLQVYRNDDREGTPWKRSSYLHGEHPDSYGSAWEAMKASNDDNPR